MAPPGGLPAKCMGPQIQPDHLRVGVGAGLLETTLRFEEDRDVTLEMTSIILSAAWLLNEKWTLSAGAGVLVDGSLEPGPGLSYDVEPGGLVALGAEYAVRAGDGVSPYVDLSLSLSASWAQTLAPISGVQTRYFASDARLGARAVWDLGSGLFPYVAGRVFGGPVQWTLAGKDITGSDINHYQLALGAAVQLGSVAVFGEYSGLGEGGASAGLSTAW